MPCTWARSQTASLGLCSVAVLLLTQIRAFSLYNDAASGNNLLVAVPQLPKSLPKTERVSRDVIGTSLGD